MKNIRTLTRDEVLVCFFFNSPESNTDARSELGSSETTRKMQKIIPLARYLVANSPLRPTVG